MPRGGYAGDAGAPVLTWVRTSARAGAIGGLGSLAPPPPPALDRAPSCPELSALGSGELSADRSARAMVGWFRADELGGGWWTVVDGRAPVRFDGRVDREEWRSQGILWSSSDSSSMRRAAFWTSGGGAVGGWEAALLGNSPETLGRTVIVLATEVWVGEKCAGSWRAAS